MTTSPIKPKFSDRMGVTQPIPLQITSTNAALRNTIWNWIYSVIHEQLGHHTEVFRWLAEHFFKTPTMDVPDESFNDGINWLKKRYELLQWYDIYNLLEFIVDHVDKLPNKFVSDRPSMMLYLNSLLERERSGFRFMAGGLAPLTNEVEVTAVSSAIEISDRKGLKGVYDHLSSAVRCFSSRPEPDYRNTIKEAISAIESVAKLITGKDSGGLKDALKELETHIPIHGSLKQGMLNLYGYASDEDGIRHAIVEEKNVSFDEAKLALVICSSLVHYLIAKADVVGLLEGTTA
jgi:hypothetical protein